jgi:hypothetical protein
MEIKLSEKHIFKMNNWLSFYNDENKNATCTGVYAGLKYTLEKIGIYNNVTSKNPIIFTVKQNVIDELIEHMNKNSINAMWNLGVATGICWALELLNILDTDFSNTKAEGF